MKSIFLGIIFSVAGHIAVAAGSPSAREGIEWCDIWISHANETNLPRVLLIGDSISIGYTPPVRELLKGKANVHRIPTNGGPTTNALRNLKVWLGTGKWDVIHFNFGIHDRATPLADYTQRLEQLVERMKKTGAKLVWASTMPIPGMAPLPKPGTPPQSK